MKIFQLKWINQDETEWIAAPSILAAIRAYCSDSGNLICELDDEDEISEIPECEWPKYTIQNEDGPDETFAAFMASQPNFVGIICGTPYLD